MKEAIIRLILRGFVHSIGVKRAIQEVEIAGKTKVIFELAGRAQGNLEKTGHIGIAATTASLCNISRNKGTTPPDLVDRQRKLVSLFPNLKLFKISHLAKI
jgi:hypothetical protein